MEEVQRLETVADPLLTCCLCKRLLQDAVQLTCLHNCCRQCFSKAASNDICRDIMCGCCSTVSHAVTEQPNSFIDFLVQRHMSIGDLRMCTDCRKSGIHDKPAQIWCRSCQITLCGDCIAKHHKHYTRHITQSINIVARLEEQCLPPPPASCLIHKKPLDFACITCEMPICITCMAQCKEEKHKMHIVGGKLFDKYVGKFTTCISSMESELLRKANILEKPKKVLAEVKTARTIHLEQINQRKLRILEAVIVAYQKIECLTKGAYDDLQGECNVIAADADRIASNLSDARNYVHRLVESNNSCEILKQQKVVQQRLRVLSDELDNLRSRLTTARRTVKTDLSLPDDLENVVKSWIGMPRWHSGCQEASAVQLKTCDRSCCAAGSKSSSISQSSSGRHSSTAATAHDSLKRDFGYEFKGGILIETKSGRRFAFKSQDEYEQIGMVVNEYIYSLLEGEGLELRMLERHDAAAPPRGFFFASKDVDTNAEGMLVLIHGTGAVRAGQWSRSLIINESVESGSQLPYIREAKKRNWSVVVMNTNQNNDSYSWCKYGEFFAGYNPEDHGVRVWKSVIEHSPARHVAIVAHSFGGHVTSCLLRKMGSTFKKKVVAIALTDSFCSVELSDRDYFKRVARNWVASKLPVGDTVGYAFDCERVSAGTTVHEETSWKSMKSVFAFIDGKFLPAADGSKTVASRPTTTRYWR